MIVLGYESLIILGDFNDTCTEWDSNHEHSELGNGLFDLVNIFDMVQLIEKPITPTSANIVDLVIMDSPDYIQKTSLLPLSSYI